ncbi:MAG TPA: terminase gpA endonuclease subunit, partial [Dissulfurispiraceae bacterium]|nr:terminase gpA endonuclease subunit [Dissulfurispiraceae bacterium]
PPEGEPYPPGFVHFPIDQGADLPYFEQLTAEIPQTKYKNGHPYRVWTLPSGRRCEAWDCFVYAYGALDLLKIRDIGRFVDKYAGENVIIIKEPAEDEAAAPVQSFVAKTNSIKRSLRSGGWVSRW